MASDRPVADIVSPIWRNEKERDDAGEARQLVRLLGIKSGMTIADIGAGSGYYVERLSRSWAHTAASSVKTSYPKICRTYATSARSWLTKRHDNCWRATRSTIANQIGRYCDPSAHVS